MVLLGRRRLRVGRCLPTIAHPSDSHTVTEVHIYKSGCVQWGSLGGRRGPPARPVQAHRLASPKRRSLACSYESGLRQVFRPSPAPPPSDGFRVRGGAPLTASANVCPHALFTCKSASTLCAATPLLVCLIDTYQKGRPNADYTLLSAKVHDLSGRKAFDGKT